MMPVIWHESGKAPSSLSLAQKSYFSGGLIDQGRYAYANSQECAILQISLLIAWFKSDYAQIRVSPAGPCSGHYALHDADDLRSEIGADHQNEIHANLTANDEPGRRVEVQRDEQDVLCLHWWTPISRTNCR